MIASVVSINAATEAACWIVSRVTLSGSITPSSNRSTNSPLSAFRPEHARQPARRRVVALRQGGDQAVAAAFHQPAHHLPQLGARRVDTVQLREGLGGAAREHVVEQRVEEARVGYAKQRARRLRG